MASKAFFTALAIAGIVIVPALATEFTVGDDKGWTLNFDYQAWAEGKTFNVGDKLTFNYKQGAHNVHRVNGTAFQQCAPPLTSEPLTSGNDVITLATPGRKWYICGVGSHCETGKMKFVITVLPQVGSPASPPSPTSAASGIVSSKSFAWLIPALALLSIY